MRLSAVDPIASCDYFLSKVTAIATTIKTTGTYLNFSQGKATKKNYIYGSFDFRQEYVLVDLLS